MSVDIMQNVSQYRPTKTVWFWSCAGVAALTMVVGFTAGGWVTSSTAAEQAETMKQNAVATLAANICANRFLAAPNAQTQLAQLKETDSWKQDTFIEEGGWTSFASMEQPIEGAADLCADKLLASDTAAAVDGNV
ncbi:hypothetical protein LKR43_12270 [Pusillimonas sp. MFBS29]|uniref:hypothetical protein n=1 Tax=Pusillimonas sp. MFBS29 TaxID=2886690 RepID=UPI001D11F5B9|nr:hypothetical protein [Pusillimonas sp. MFBS29]MCC2597117.1 hypothetical protein [Pusillimonas sp. MFBS29]